MFLIYHPGLVQCVSYGLNTKGLSHFTLIVKKCQIAQLKEVTDTKLSVEY
jgi:hypothetical protein